MSRLRSFTTAVLVVSMGSCSPAAPSRADVKPAIAQDDEERPPPIAPNRDSPVVLVTIDGVRWQDVFASPHLMPTLHTLGREHGAFLGAHAHTQIRASGPNFVSLPGYTEILTGRPSTSCADNECPPTRMPTVLDRAAEAGLNVAAFASWERLDRAVSAQPGRFFVSAGREANDTTAPWPGSGRYRPDARTADLALAFLEHARPDVLFLGLGDPDEHAHHGDVSGYRASLIASDDVLRRLRIVLDRMRERGRATHVFVTADHGRANDFRSHGGHAPESARVWLVGAGPRIRARGAPPSPRERHLADIAPTIATLVGVDLPRTPGRGEVLTELF